MGNIQETIKGFIINLALSIEKENFEESDRLYKKYKKELDNYKNEKAKQIILILSEFLRDNLNIDIINYLTNLKTKDKIDFLFEHVFEGILINSTNFKETDINSGQDIQNYINKIEKSFKKVVLISSINFLEEKLANLYFLLADIQFKKFAQNSSSSIKILDEIIDNIGKTIFKS